MLRCLNVEIYHRLYHSSLFRELDILVFPIKFVVIPKVIEVINVKKFFIQYYNVVSFLKLH